MPTSPNPIQPVILCGGSGAGLWPLSRAGFPKQSLSLTGKETLFQLAEQRLQHLAGAPSAPFVVGNEGEGEMTRPETPNSRRKKCRRRASQ